MKRKSRSNLRDVTRKLERCEWDPPYLSRNHIFAGKPGVCTPLPSFLTQPTEFKKSDVFFKLSFRGQVLFNAQLVLMRCIGLNSEQERCGNWVDVGAPFCMMHLKHIYNVTLGQTTLVGSDKTRFSFCGLFAATDFDADKPIVPYLGSDDIEFPMIDQAHDTYVRCGTSAMQLRGAGGCANTVLKTRPKKDNFGRPVVGVDEDRCNATMVERNIVAKKPIRSGEEIFVSYGTRLEQLDLQGFHSRDCYWERISESV